MKDIDNIKKIFDEIEIPGELEFVVDKAIKMKGKRRKGKHIIIKSVLSAAAACILFIGIVNLSPVAADAMSDVPVIGNLVQLVSFKTLTYQDDRHTVDIEVPKVEGLKDQELQEALNDKYKEENTKLYKDFMNKIDNNKITPPNLALYKEYNIIVQTEDFMVVQAITTEIEASGAESVRYDNVDLNNQIIISLPSLFKDDSYVDIISDNIIEQMKAKMENNDGSMYFLAESGDIGGFDKIKPEQSFYINSDGKLVISFDEYEVAPGVMGMVEFVVPTEVIQDILVSNTYIK